MSNSKLVEYTKISPHKNPRKNDTYNKTGKITKITIHHMAGNLSVESCGNVFQKNTVRGLLPAGKMIIKLSRLR